MSKISIIVPVYNAEKYIEKCLDSILNQTYKNIEVIVVNSGSTDNSEAIIKQYEDIKYIQAGNNGVSVARNIGIESVTGDYFCFVDADDYIDKKLIESLSNYIQENYDLIKFKLKKVDNKFEEIEKIDGPIFKKKTGEEAFAILKYKDVLLESPCLYLLNTKFYKENNFEFTKDTFHEDLGLIPLVLVKANSVISTDVYGYYYVQSENSITRNNPYKKIVKRANDMFIHYDNMLKFIEKNNISEKSKKSIKDFYSNAVILKTEELKEKEQKEYIKEIKKRKLIKNIQVRNVKQIIKKILLKINVKLYLKLR